MSSGSLTLAAAAGRTNSPPWRRSLRRGRRDMRTGLAAEAGVTSDAAVVPVAEGLEQRVLRGRRERAVADVAQRPDRRAHLPDVRAAAVAFVEVGLEARPVIGTERALQVVGHELGELAARHALKSPPTVRGRGARRRRSARCG